MVYNPPEQWKIIDGHHPAIISQELWDAVQSRRKSRYFYVDNKHVASPLAGLVHCAKCGHLMNLQGKNKGVPYLLCPTKGCSAGAKYEFVEHAVLRQLETMAHNLEVEVAQNVPPDISALESSLSRMKAQQVHLEERRSRLYSLLEDGTYSRTVFSERMQVLAQEEAALKEHVASLEGDIRLELSRNKEKQLAQLRTVLERYQSSSLPGRKELLRSVVSDILYTKEKKTKPADFTLSIELKDFI